MLKLFAWEYVTSGGLEGSEVSLDLLAEAQAMLERLSADLSAIDGVELLGGGSWAELLQQADIVWPVAPETDGILERVAGLAREACDRVLISGPEALAIAASKARTAAHLAAHGVKVVPVWAPGKALPSSPRGYVVKPDDGAGTEDTVFVPLPIPPPQAGEGILKPSPFRGSVGRGRIIQPYIPGQPLSLSLLAKDGEAWVLACNTQDVTLEDDRFVYRGGIVGGAEDRRALLEPIAVAVAASLPDLFGYIGIDLIDGPDGLVVVEINPRVTTSYVGLHESLGINPAGLALKLFEHSIAELRQPLHPKPVKVTVPA